MLAVAVTGMLTGLSLIVAIGAQNAFVLRQGLLRSHIGVVVTICTLSDAVLILAGVGGLGLVTGRVPWLVTVLKVLGVLFLVWYGVAALRRARRPGTLSVGAAHGGSLPRVAGETTAITWLNPHVYLDTMLLLGSIAATHGAAGRWWFGAGAAMGSLVWFTGLGYGSRAIAPVFARPRAWQVLDMLVGGTMLVIAGRLALG